MVGFGRLFGVIGSGWVGPLVGFCLVLLVLIFNTKLLIDY